MRMGNYLIFPEAGAAVVFDDNIFTRDYEKRSDWRSELTGGVQISVATAAPCARFFARRKNRELCRDIPTRTMPTSAPASMARCISITPIRCRRACCRPSNTKSATTRPIRCRSTGRRISTSQQRPTDRSKCSTTAPPSASRATSAGCMEQLSLDSRELGFQRHDNGRRRCLSTRICATPVRTSSQLKFGYRFSPGYQLRRQGPRAARRKPRHADPGPRRLGL